MARTKQTERMRKGSKAALRAIKHPMSAGSKKGSKVAAPAVGGIAQRKKIRFNWRTTACRQIRKAQRGVDMLMQKQPFMRDVRATVEGNADNPTGMRFTEGAMGAMMEATQKYLLDLFAFSHQTAIHAKRVTVMQKDIDFYTRNIKPCLASNRGR